MASRKQCDPRIWNTFWSTIDKENTRYRHQVRQHKHTKVWLVRTEIWEGEVTMPYYGATLTVTKEVGDRLWAMRTDWSNIGEHGRPLYPPEFQGGFT